MDTLINAGATRRDYWLCQTLGWGSLAVVAILASSQGGTESSIRFALAKISCMLAALMVSDRWHDYLRVHGWLDRNRAFPFKGILIALSLMAIVQVAFLMLSDVVFRKGAIFSGGDDIVIITLLLFFLWFGAFSVWTLAYAMVLSRRRALRFELEKLELEVSAKDAELRALQAQINPHFFFNSLNSIRALIYQDADAAARAVGQLAGMMRHTLQAGQASTVRLADELTAVTAYLAMEKLRFDERLQLQLVVQPGLDEVPMPPMVLQTLVENAVKHGVERSMTACQIVITAARVGQAVQLCVANEGTLVEVSASTRLGLANASKRLALLFGPSASCTLTEDGGWVRATVILPQVPA